MDPDIKKLKSYINTDIKLKYKYDSKYLDDISIDLKRAFRKPIGLFDPLGENINPLTGKDYTDMYADNLLMYKKGPLDDGNKYKMTYSGQAYDWSNLTIYSHMPEILDSIKTNQITLVKAGTGVGKTVITPKAALQAFNFQKKVICAIPKRSATKTTAEYAASCMDVKLGEEIGYVYKGGNNVGKNTKLTFTTTGTLKSIITGTDQYLMDYDCVILDEIHERSVQIDQLLYFIKKILTKRPEFRLVLMSATVDTSIFKNYFREYIYKDFDYPGKTYHVDIIYELTPILDWKIAAINCLQKILTTTTEGDILIFIKSGGEGTTLCNSLKALYRKPNTEYW